MRKSRYVVAISVEGYNAGPNGEANWIGSDPEIDVLALWSHFDILLMGRKTYEAATWARGRLQELPASCSRER
jgi:hypothetical protein